MFSKKGQAQARNGYHLAHQNDAEIVNHTGSSTAMGPAGAANTGKRFSAGRVNKPRGDRTDKTSLSLFQELRNAFRECCSHSTVHGCSNIARSKSIPITLMWTVFLSISIGVCSYFIFGILANYLSYKVLILMNVIDESPVDFPAVSSFFNLTAFLLD